jgi:hypothetical protein
MPLDHGRQLAQILLRAHLVEAADSYTLIPLDQPIELARIVRQFHAASIEVIGRPSKSDPREDEDAVGPFVSLEERLVFSSIGRHLIDDGIVSDEVELGEPFAELTRLGMTEVHPVAES